MSFTLQKTVTATKSYPSLQNVLKQGEEEIIEVTYEVHTIISLTGAMGIAEYSVSIPNADKLGSGVVEFAYKGGSPFEEAEQVLKASLS